MLQSVLLIRTNEFTERLQLRLIDLLYIQIYVNIAFKCQSAWRRPALMVIKKVLLLSTS